MKDKLKKESKSKRKLSLERENRSSKLIDPPIETFEEYYAIPQYAKDSKGDQKYARKRNHDQFYLQDENGKPIYANKKSKLNEDEPYFAVDAKNNPIVAVHENIPIYPFNQTGLPVFPMVNDDQIYASVDGQEMYPQLPNKQEIYAKNKTLDEYPATNADKEKYYACKLNDKDELIEYPPTNHKGEPEYIILKDDKIKYPFNINLEQFIFEKDQQGNDMYFKTDKNDEYYPADEETEFYGKFNNNTEKLAKLENGQEYYAVTWDQNEIYPKLYSGSEYYKIMGDTEIPAKKSDNNHYYAKTKDQDEYYPKIFFDGTTRDLDVEPESFFGD